MPRILSIAGCIAVLLARSLDAQPSGNRAEEFPLPLEKVVLFTSGVGYFQPVSYTHLTLPTIYSV